MASEFLDERDELIDRATRALRAMPAPNPHAVSRIAAAVRGRRAQPPARWSVALEWMREPSLSVASAGFLAAAALAIGFVTRGALTALDDSASELARQRATVAAADVPLRPVADARGEVRRFPVPIVFEGPLAAQVAIVGDFNSWDATATPMRRFGKDGPWTATVLATPGRHTYAFLVDGATLVADPRAPRARDLDYGGVASVLMVSVP